MDKLKVGQTIYIKPINNEARYDKMIKTGEIATVGRKYFTLTHSRYGRFKRSDLMHDGSPYAPDYKGYLSMADIEDEKEKIELESYFRIAFRYIDGKDLTLDQLIRMKDIAEEKKPLK